MRFLANELSWRFVHSHLPSRQDFGVAEEMKISLGGGVLYFGEVVVVVDRGRRLRAGRALLGEPEGQRGLPGG